MTLDEIEALFVRIVDESYSTAMLGGDGRPMFRAFWRTFEAVSEYRNRRSQGTFLMPYGTQTDDPATFGRRAAFTVTLARTGSMELALYIAPGKMTLEGPGGRLYTNVEAVAYKYRDAITTRDVRFECILPGEVGNLDFLANDDLVSPAGSIPTEHMLPADQSRGRANRDATSTTYGSSSAIKDTGIPSTFEASDEGLYVEILFSAVAANIGRIVRIKEHVWPGIEEPVGSNIRPTYAVLDDTGIRSNLAGAKLDDGGVFTDNTDDANGGTTFALLPAAPAVADAFYFGAGAPITSLVITINTALDADLTLVWEYWDGGAWTTATVTDDTEGLTKSGTRTITFADYALMASSTVDGVAAYWVRARVSAFVSITTVPIASYTYPNTYVPLAADAGDIEWIVRDWKDLGFEVQAVVQIETGRNDDLYFHGDQRGQYAALGESEEAFRSRISRPPDVVTPAALTRVVNQILAPLKLKGRVIDLGDTVDGFFWDVDAFEYYDGGGPYPTSPWKLLLSLNEAYGFFYVEVPWIAEGDFGLFYDEGPLLLLEDLGLYLGPAYDESFYDGFSQTAQTVYMTIYEEIRRRKAGGTAFAIIPNADLNVPP